MSANPPPAFTSVVRMALPSAKTVTSSSLRPALKRKCPWPRYSKRPKAAPVSLK